MLFERYELDRLLDADGKFLRNVTNQMLSEAVGEGATEISNMVADYLIMGKNSQYEQNIQRYLNENPTWTYKQAAKQALIDSALQVAEASFGGALSGGIMGAGMSVLNTKINTDTKLPNTEVTQPKDTNSTIDPGSLKLNPDSLAVSNAQTQSDNRQDRSFNDPESLSTTTKEDASTKQTTPIDGNIAQGTVLCVVGMPLCYFSKIIYKLGSGSSLRGTASLLFNLLIMRLMLREVYRG